MAKRKKKYYQGRKDRKDESMGMMNSGNPSWFGVSEDASIPGVAPSEVITRYSDSYSSGDNIYYEQGMAYQDKQCEAVQKGLKKQKLNGHF